MKIVNQGLRIIIGLIAVVLLVNGFQWAFIPQNLLDTYGIVAESPLGINMLKSDIGAGLISAAIFLMMFALKNGFWFYPAAILTASFLIIRIISLFVDGSDPTIVMGIALEAIVLIALFIVRYLDTKEEK